MVLVNGRLIYNIHTPIPNTDIYNVIKFTSLPFPYNTYGHYIYDGVYEGAIALSQDNTHFTHVDKNECSHAGKEYYCQIKGSIKKIRTNTHV